MIDALTASPVIEWLGACTMCRNEETILQCIGLPAPSPRSLCGECRRGVMFWERVKP